MILVGAFLLLILFLAMGVPIPLTFLGSAAFIVYLSDTDPLFLLSYGASQINSVLLLTIPLFVLAGSIMDHGGIGVRLINAVENLGFRKIRGGLGIVTAVSSAVFGAISGSAGATIACIGSIMSPRLEENGYEKGFIGALISSCAVLGLLIPPSMSMILYGWVGGQSVLACFLSSVIPGIILIILFSIINLIYAAKNPNMKTKGTSQAVMLYPSFADAIYYPWLYLWRRADYYGGGGTLCNLRYPRSYAVLSGNAGEGFETCVDRRRQNNWRHYGNAFFRHDPEPTLYDE